MPQSELYPNAVTGYVSWLPKPVPLRSKSSKESFQLKAFRPTVSGVSRKYGSVKDRMMFRRMEPMSPFRVSRWPRPKRLFSWMRALKRSESAELNPAPALKAPVCASFTLTTTPIRSSSAGAPRGDVHLLEEAEALECLAALPELLGREELLLLETHLAPDDLVARLRVPGDLDPVDDDLAAAVDLERDVDLLRLGVDLGLRLDVGERVAVLG
jgi:hypothetical protein